MSEFGYHELERYALGFVLEDETWPVFLAWVELNHVSVASHAWLESGPDLAGLRREWMRHSPDPPPAGGWHPQLPVMSRIEWMNQEPLDKAMRFGPKPAYGEWIQLGWTRVPWDGVRRVPVWQQLGPRLTGGEAG